jgi:hypothetical protein
LKFEIAQPSEAPSCWHTQIFYNIKKKELLDSLLYAHWAFTQIAIEHST